MADNVMTLRLVVKRIAMAHGAYATFIPKPLNGVQGSGMHTHMSLFREGANVFHDADDPAGVSGVGRHFMAGVLVHAREITAVANQLVNSYKRLGEASEAPQHVVWARNNRSALVRVPRHRRAKPESTRIEYPGPGPGLQPVPGLRAAAGRWDARHRASLRTARRDDSQPVRPVR